MIHENELVMLLLSIGVTAFAVYNRQRFFRIYNWKLLITAFVLFPAACLFTIAEEFLFPDIFNYMEHLCYAGNAVLLMAWCISALKLSRNKND